MFPHSMRGRIAILAASLVAVVALVVVLTSGGGNNNPLKELQEKHPVHKLPPIPGEPSVDVVAPRNGSRQTSGAVVVHVVVHNFRLSPGQFGHEPELDEGHIRFQLHRVPNCASTKRLKQALKSPFGSGRLLGLSFDYPRYSGPNGVLAERLGRRRQLLARDPAGHLLPRPAGGLLPHRHQPGQQQRDDDALPRRHQLRDPAPTRPERRSPVQAGNGPQLQGLEGARITLQANTSLCIVR